MDIAHALTAYRDQVGSALQGQRRDAQPARPLAISRWLAMSLMQKAMRRGRVELALAAGSTLWAHSPTALWRRLLVTAFEDVGVADVELVAVVTAAAGSKVWRATVGGEWPVAAYLIERIATAAKCRAADDLAYVAEKHPDLEPVRRQLVDQSDDALHKLALSDSPIAERALALWLAIGTARCRSNVLDLRRGSPDVTFDVLLDAGIPDTVVETARMGVRKTGEAICAFLPLLWKEAQQQTASIVSDDLPTEELIGEVPCWAYDMHVREGNLAMARFLKGGGATAMFLERRVKAGQRTRVLGEMLFRVESGLVDRRRHWDTGIGLMRVADLELCDMPPNHMEFALNLLRRNLHWLNEERRNVAISNLR